MDKEYFNCCLADIRNGDIDALEPIYREYYVRLVLTAKNILKDKSLAEDAASDTLMRLIEYAGSHENPKIDKPNAFLYVSVRNIALDMQRRNSRTMPLDCLYEVAAVTDVERNTRIAEVHKFLETLCGVEFQIADMFYFYGYQIDEIALYLNMPEGTVKWRISEIKKRLKSFCRE